MREPNLGETHAVTNVSSELSDTNLFLTDTPLVEAVAREGGAWGLEKVADFGALTGRAEHLELGHLANKYTPELDTHDRFGRRVDLVRYHDAYHQLMRTSLEHGLHSAPWTDPRSGAHVVRAAHSALQGQVEAGHGCPVTMTFASIPSIRMQPELAAQLEGKILARGYDPRNVPMAEKSAITVGMGMTEKQGGSDVRANSTRATPVGQPGPGQLYELTGHKWFLSAPMCDAFLVLAQTEPGLACFLVPRWLPDGRKNALNVIRLKDKMANRSNASSEVELRGAQGWLIGQEGRGVPTIIEMVGLTRFDCMVGSAALMRAGLANALHHCGERSAFGARLRDQPLMQNVLSDLALEYEAAIAFSMRMARALDTREHDAHEGHLLRVATAVGKYWVCKRTPQHTYEIMECIGGSGVMENSVYPRLFRESVINPIWEGSGNVQCLDVLRAVMKNPEVMRSFLAEVKLAQGGNARLDAFVWGLEQQLGALDFTDMRSVEFASRHVVDQLALAFQGALLVRHAPSAVSEAFCSSRLAGGHHQYGALPVGTDVQTILERADPAVSADVSRFATAVAAASDASVLAGSAASGGAGTRVSSPTARRVVLGLLLAKDGAPLAVRYAIAACALFGITENNVRVTLARLSAEGLIEASGRGAYVIGHAGARLNAAVSEWRRAEERVRPWEGRYVLVHTGPLPRGDRRVVQRRERALALYGLRELERGLFVRPDNLAGGAAALRQRLVAVGLEPDAAVFDAGGFDDVREARITALWDGAALTAAYHAEHERLTTWLAHGAELEPEVAARECYLLGGAAIRQVVFDPWLPEPLVDTAARTRFVATVKAFDQAGKAIWEAFGEGHARMPVPTVKGELRPRTH